MELMLRRATAAPLPWSPSDVARSAAKAVWCRMVARLYNFAKKLPSSRGEAPPEWFRFPLP